MSTPQAKSPERLHPFEGEQLTIALGSKCYGSDYDNPELYGMFANFESRNWRYKHYLENPEPYDRQVQEQIDVLQGVLEPYIGRVAVGKTIRPAIKHAGEDTWEQWELTAPFFAKGHILGVEGHPVSIRKFHRLGGASREFAPDLRWKGFRIGVVLDVDSPDAYVSHNMRLEDSVLTIPTTDRVLIPVRDFPAHRVWFHPLSSNQLQ